MAISACSGPSAGKLQNDCYVEIERMADTGVVVDIQSTVFALYGESIRSQATDLLGKLGVSRVRLSIRDSGALPFAIAARIESAVEKLVGASCAQQRGAMNAQRGHRDRMRRTRLYIPGNTPKYFANAGLYGADAVIFDLEDSVPLDGKRDALLLVRNALDALDLGPCERMVRVNALPDGFPEVEALLQSLPLTFVLPKTEGPDAIRDLDSRIPADADVLLIPILESAQGVLNAYEIATSSPRVAALAIGLEDYVADIGAERTAEGLESQWAYGQVVNAARAAGIQPLASAYSGVDDPDGLEAYVVQVKRFGFEGIGCIHPSQVRIVHRAFAPTADEIAKAQRIVAATTEQGGVAKVDGGMIDAPVVARARRVLDRARSMEEGQ